MRRVFGPRTAVEAAFLVAVPIVVGVVVGAGMWTIVAASAVAYLLIVFVEAFLWYESRRRPPASRPPEPQPRPRPQPKPRPAVEPVVLSPREEPRAPEPPPTATPAPAEHVRVLAREADPGPIPVAPPPLVAVPAPEPDPEPEPVAAPAAPASTSTVVPIGVGSSPRRWNLWDLERLTREHSGADAARDEERTFLLMYLREFADADGLLPIDFDGLVRDSFGELVGSR